MNARWELLLIADNTKTLHIGTLVHSSHAGVFAALADPEQFARCSFTAAS